MNEGDEVRGFDIPPIRGVRFRLSERSAERELRLRVPVPVGYESRLTAHMRANRVTDLVDVKLTMTGPNVLALHLFYVRPRQYREYSTREESRVFKGVGRKVLCYGIMRFVDRLADPATATIGLTASGDECSDPERYQNWTFERLDEYLLRYPFTRRCAAEALRQRSLDALRRVVCIVENNRRLVAYYNQLGLQAYDETDGKWIMMEGGLTDVLRTCHSIVRAKSLNKRQRDIIDRASSSVWDRSREDSPPRKRARR